MSRRLVELIEQHADELTRLLVQRLKEHRTTIGLRKYDDLELGRRGHELYQHLGYWLRATNEAAVEEAFLKFGAQGKREGVPLSDLVGALLLTRRILWEFVEWQAGDTILDLRQEIDLQILVMRFFDRAVYWSVRGYEGPSVVEAVGVEGAKAPAVAGPKAAATR